MNTDRNQKETWKFFNSLKSWNKEIKIFAPMTTKLISFISTQISALSLKSNRELNNNHSPMCFNSLANTLISVTKTYATYFTPVSVDSGPSKI